MRHRDRSHSARDLPQRTRRARSQVARNVVRPSDALGGPREERAHVTGLKTLLVSLVIAGCAPIGSNAGGSPLGRPTATKVRLDLAPATGSTSDAARLAFPAPVSVTAPSIDRIAATVRAALGDAATAELDLCIAVDGSVASAKISHSSSLAPFDQALLRDARSWRFATMPGPASLQSCRRATVRYAL